MGYRLEFTPEVQKQLHKMDKHQASFLTRWLYQHIDGTENPRQHGKALLGTLQGLWRYRVGNYRVIVEIDDNQLVVIAIQIGHRRNVYK